MNIIYARMKNYDWVSVPSDAVARELEKLGHNVTILDSVNYIPPNNYDFVWSPYESVTLLGHAISKKINVPHFAHIEWIPPWRLLKCDVTKYGYKGDEKELEQLHTTKPHYDKVLLAWSKAAFKSIGIKCMVPFLKDYMKKELNIELKDVILRYPSVDFDTLQQGKDIYSPQKNPKRIITISRAVPNKRYDLLLKVINKIDVDCEWIIIGDGPMQKFVTNNLTKKNVKLFMLGARWGWDRLYQLIKSSIYIGGWTGMPPIEAAYLGSFPILFDQGPTKEVPTSLLKEYFNGHVSTYTDEDKMAEHMTNVLTHKDKLEIDTGCKKIIDTCLEGKMGITSCEQNAKNIVKTIEGQNPL